MADQKDIDRLILFQRVSQFLYHEARLLDEQKWDEWEALFTDHGAYWAPASPDQPDPHEHMSLIYEDQLLRKVRIARFSNPNAFSLQPFPRSTHIVSNVMIDEESDGVIITLSRFQMAEYRREQPNYFTGTYRHELVEDGASFKIKLKKAVLVNCDGVQPSSSIYF